MKLLQSRLDWTFDNEEPPKDGDPHPPFEAWPDDAQAFLLQKIREERLDEVYSTGRRLFLKALNEEGLSPRPSSAWVAFTDALLDQEDGDFAGVQRPERVEELRREMDRRQSEERLQ